MRLLTRLRKFDKRSFVLVFIGIAAGVLAVTIAKAQSTDIIQACVAQPGSNAQSQNVSGQANTGSVRIVQDQADCKTGETYITWSVQGPQGIPGPSGPPGPSGVPGPSGAPGSSSQLRVVDSQQQELGWLFTRNAVIREINGYMVEIPFTLSGIQMFSTTNIYGYTSTDCSGTQFIPNPTNSLIRYGYLIGNQNQVYFAGEPTQQSDIIHSYQYVNHVDPNSSGPCTVGNVWSTNPWNPPTFVGPAQVFTLPTFVPPLTISN